MKKLFFAFALGILAFFSANQANAQSYGKGQTDLHFGIGLLGTFYGSGVNTILPPVNIAFETGVADNIGVGGFLGFSTARANYNILGSKYHWNYNYILLGARGAYHFRELLEMDEKWDPYGGLMLGYYIANATFHSDDPNLNEDLYDSPVSSSVGWSLYAGTRYKLTEKLGVYGELGYGFAVFNVGLHLKVK
ncbi:MAG: outer membrane beta-barrel protein [Saprospiraceae bacterium]|nr:outer membrane beta-barrel protein [Lewinellaceae bacterium]MBP6811995.1 outer membrane beta-barrel protein [Saprospiraceae bacterium]